MATDANILLQGQVPNIGNALLAFQKGQQMRQQRDEAPLRNRLLTAQADGAEQQQKIGAQQLEQGEQEAIIRAAVPLKGYLDSNDLPGAKTWLQGRRQALIDANKNTTQTDEALQMLESNNVDGLKSAVNQLYKQGILTKVIAEPVMHNKSMTGDLQLALSMGLDLSKPADQQKFQQFKLGMRPSGTSDGYHPPVNTSTGVLAWDPGQKKYTPMMDPAGKPYLPPSMDANAAQDVSFGRTTGSTTAKNASAFENLADAWDTNKAFLLESVPEIDAAIKAAPGSSLSNAVQSGLSKVIGNTEGADAQAQVRQYGAMFLQGMPFPPGSQSDAEMKQRASVLSDQLVDPNLSPKAKIRLIGNFVQWQDSKAGQQRKKADELRGRQPNGGAQKAAPAQPASSPAGHKVGDVIEHGGKRYRVTGGDPNDPDVEEVQ